MFSERKFSERTNWTLAQNRFTQAVEEVRASGTRILDLTVSNPTRAGLRYAEGAILSALSSPRALDYDPQAKGLLAAREAVSGYYRDRGGRGQKDVPSNVSTDGSVDPEHIVLTTSTSEAYSFVFRLLCNAGDELLVPKPSYPLFEFLADLQDVRLVPYPLIYDHGWQMDFPSLEKAVTERTRGVVVVHPNNPTGSFVSAGEVELLNEFCREHGLAVIADEVFLDYGLDAHAAQGSYRACLRRPRRRSRPAAPSGCEESGTPASGLDEFCGQSGGADVYAERAVEGGGAAADESGLGGDQRTCGEVAAAMGRLEVIADTYLSMNAPVQWAVPALLEQRNDIQRQLMERVTRIWPSWIGNWRGRRLASG